MYNLFLRRFERTLYAFCNEEQVDYDELITFCDISFTSGDRRTKSFVRSMQQLMQYTRFFGMMHAFAQGGPAPYTFKEQQTSCNVIATFGVAQLCGDALWERRLRWLHGSRGESGVEVEARGRRDGHGDEREGEGMGDAQEKGDAFLMSFFAFKRAQSHWEEYDRLNAREEEEEEEVDCGTVLGQQYESDDEEEMSSRDVRMYVGRLYREGRLSLEEYHRSLQWAGDKDWWSKGEWKRHARRRKEDEHIQVLNAATIMQHHSRWLWQMRFACILSAWCARAQRKEVVRAALHVAEAASAQHTCWRLLLIWRREGRAANVRACDEEVQQFVTARGGGGSAQRKLIVSLTMAPPAAQPRPPTAPRHPRTMSGRCWSDSILGATLQAKREWGGLRERSEEEEEAEVLLAMKLGQLSSLDSASVQGLVRRQAEQRAHLRVAREMLAHVVQELVAESSEEALRERRSRWEASARKSMLRRVKVLMCAHAPRLDSLIGHYGPQDLPCVTPCSRHTERGEHWVATLAPCALVAPGSRPAPAGVEEEVEQRGNTAGAPMGAATAAALAVPRVAGVVYM